MVGKLSDDSSHIFFINYPYNAIYKKRMESQCMMIFFIPDKSCNSKDLIANCVAGLPAFDS